MNSISHRQINIDLFPHGNGFHFQYHGKNYVLPSRNKVHAFFQKQPFDTVKLVQDGKPKYLHDMEVFNSKKDLRKTLSQESGGAWIEEKEGKKHYFVDDSGWFNTSFKQVPREEFLQRLDSPSTMQKVLGIGLGILALLPGALEIKERLPFGASEAGMGLLALQQRSHLLGALGLSLSPSSAMAQAVGTEFQVNSYTTGSQSLPAMAPLNDGGFVVAWTSIEQDEDSGGIFAQRYGVTGAFLGSEFQVNNYTTSSQSNPAIAALKNGGFVVVWQSDGQDGDSYGIFAQRYDASGTLYGSEFQVNNYTTGDQRYPAIAPLNDGGFVVAWRSSGQDGALNGIFAQMYNTSGTLIGSEFQVNNYTTSDQRDPAIASLNDGGFVVTWMSSGQDGDSWGIFAQKYDTSGVLIGSEFQVNNYTTSDQRDPAIASLNDGDFVVTWTSDEQDGSFNGVFAQRYNNSGALDGYEFQINSYTTNNQHDPAIAPLNDGGFVVAWESVRGIWNVFAQRYDANGALNGSEFQVNTDTINTHGDPAIAPLNDGGFVVAWESFGQDGSFNGVFAQRYDQVGNPVPLTYSPSMSSSSALSSQLSPTSSSTSENNVLSSSSGPSSSTSVLQTTHQSGSSSPSSFQIPVLIDVVYGEIYSVQQNGQTIGTFTISGGTGPYSSSNPNTLIIEIDPDIVLQDGDTLTLFSAGEGVELQWESITFVNSDGCFNAEGELIQNENNGRDYQIVFVYEGESCYIYERAEKFNAIPALIGGNLI